SRDSISAASSSLARLSPSMGMCMIDLLKDTASARPMPASFERRRARRGHFRVSSDSLRQSNAVEPMADCSTKRIESVEFDGSLEAIRTLIGFPTIDSDEIDANGDRLWFDEECF